LPGDQAAAGIAAGAGAAGVAAGASRPLR
jgi:hypothetical protein